MQRIKMNDFILWLGIIKMTSKTIFKYEYAFGKRQFFNLLIGIGLIGCAVFLFLRFEIDSTRIILIGAFLLLGSIPLLMSWHYFKISKDLKIDIDLTKNNIYVNQKGIKSSLKLNDLTSIQIYEHKGLGLYEFEFDYAKYVFADGRYFIATSFMANEYFFPEGMEPEVIKRFFPIVRKPARM